MDEFLELTHHNCLLATRLRTGKPNRLRVCYTSPPHRGGVFLLLPLDTPRSGSDQRKSMNRNESEQIAAQIHASCTILGTPVPTARADL